MKIKTKLTLTFLLITLIPLSFLSLITYSNAQQAITTETLSKLDAIGSIQKTRIQEAIASNTGKIVQLSARLLYRTELENYNKDKNSASQAILIKDLNAVKAKLPEYKDLYILDPDGKVVASTDSSEMGKDHSKDEFFLRGKKGTDVILIFREGDDLRRWLVSQIASDNNELLGVIAAKIEPTSLLSIVGDYTGLGQTGETVIAEPIENGRALFITPTRVDPDAALKRKIDLSTKNIAMAPALSKVEGTHTGTIDYRDKTVFAATRYIEGPGWGLVVKIDADEALAPVRNLRNLSIILSVLTLLIVSIVGLIISNSISKPIVKLKEAADDISKGRTDVEIDPKLKESKDEIGELANSFERTLVSLKLAMKKVGSMPEKKKEEKE